MLSYIQTLVSIKNKQLLQLRIILIAGHLKNKVSFAFICLFLHTVSLAYLESNEKNLSYCRNGTQMLGVVNVCNLNTRELEEGGLCVQGQPELYSKFEYSLGFETLSQKNQRNRTE
jgi:hypothetical protein